MAFLEAARAAVLFDLDGTLLDTAPDLAAALNRLRQLEGLAPLPYADIRPHVSHGSKALTRLGFELPPESAEFEALRLRLLDLYREDVASRSRLFDGMATVLLGLQSTGLSWGIVTNKPGWLTTPLLAQIALPVHPGCVISGDTLSVSKPDPAPLLLAAAQLGIPPQNCLYIGDAARDVEAGQRAGMATLVAAYGYLTQDDIPTDWGAGGMVDSPLEILPHVKRWLENRKR
jgi:phosphoglycolate phosphatase